MRIGTDPEAAEHAIRELDRLRDAIGRRALLPPPPPLSLLPHQTASIAARVSGESVQIFAAAVRTDRLSGELARTTVAMMVAAGQLNDPRLAAIAGRAAASGVHVTADLTAAVIDGTADALRFIDRAWGATTGSLFVALYAHGRWAGWMVGEVGKEASRNAARQLDAFGRHFDDALKQVGKHVPGGGTALRALGALGAAVNFVDAFQKGVGNNVVRALSAGFSTALVVNPAGAVFELVSGGAVSGSVNAIFTLGAMVTGDDAVVDEFSRKAERGEYGPIFQVTAAVGDGFADLATSGTTDNFDRRAANGDFGPVVSGIRDGVNWAVDGLYNLSPFK